LSLCPTVEMRKGNQSSHTDFIILGFPGLPEHQGLLLVLFITIYVLTLMENLVLIVTIKLNCQLHTPMYFFLGNLSLLEIFYVSVTVPKLLSNLLLGEKKISFNGCITQIFFFTLFVGVEIFTLSVMAYDRYTAICDPLHYLDIMNKRFCVQMVLSTWALSFLHALINTVPVLNLHFCGSNAISHFSCELPPLLQLSCTDATINEVVLFATLVVFGLSSFLLTLISYIHIISTILRIRSVVGRHKVFSTCSSHLIVVGLLYLTGFFLYMKPNTDSLDKVVAVFYCVVTPLLNPIIYSLRNQEVKEALRKALCGKGRALK
uniref:Olfactory receptor n=1 Tax=Gopherus evgoodei TaxID=1825980 RepID=A0A8C4WJ82_9SAUR